MESLLSGSTHSTESGQNLQENKSSENGTAATTTTRKLLYHRRIEEDRGIFPDETRTPDGGQKARRPSPTKLGHSSEDWYAVAESHPRV